MNKKTKPVSPRSTNSTSTGKTAASKLTSGSDAAPEAVPDAAPTPAPETELSETTVAMRIIRPASDYVPPAGLPDSERKPVLVHDLTGYVVFALPPHLKEVLGKEALERCVSDLEAHEVIAIHREIDAIVYIRMQCVAQLFAMPKENPINE